MKNFFLRNPSRSLIGIAILIAVLFASPLAYGQSPGSVAPPAPETNIRGVGDVYAVLLQIFNILFWLLIILAGIFIIWAAFSYLTAGGEPEKIQTANKKVIYAAVAVAVAVLAKAIPTIVCNFLVDPGPGSGCEIGLND